MLFRSRLQNLWGGGVQLPGGSGQLYNLLEHARRRLVLKRATSDDTDWVTRFAGLAVSAIGTADGIADPRSASHTTDAPMAHMTGYPCHWDRKVSRIFGQVARRSPPEARGGLQNGRLWRPCCQPRSSGWWRGDLEVSRVCLGRLSWPLGGMGGRESAARACSAR